MLKKLSKRLLVCVLILFAILATAYWSLHENFHLVTPNIYRSAQLDQPELQQAIHNYKLRAILNLRGPNPSKTWYQNEIKIAKNNHVKHFDLTLLSTSLPTHHQLIKLVHILQTSPKPLLIHCAGGADRTGLASMITQLLHNKSIIEAKQQLSFRYFVLKKNSVGKQLLPKYQQWLQQNHYASSSKQRFLAWLATYKG